MAFLSQVLALLALLQITQSESTTKQCVLQELKVISFPSLESYQGSRNSFNTNHPTYIGNSVSFTFKTIDRLVKNSFISFGSNSIMQIDLQDKQIRKIDEGAFNQLFCLHFLNLKGNNITVLTENVFAGLRNLRFLDLGGNMLEHIDGLMFHNLNYLDTLVLSRNKIKTLSSLSFASLTEMTVLDLSFNKIRTFPPTLFASLSSLRKLYLNNNQLKDVEPEKWVGLKDLQVLNLAENMLSKFDTSYNFSFNSLENLNLSGNSLTYLYADDISKHLPKLKNLDITENDWLCETLEVLRHQLADSKVVLNGKVNCSISGVYRRSTTESTVAIVPASSTAAGTTTRRTRDYPKEVFVQNGAILFTNQKVLENVYHLENLVVCLFVVIIIFVIIEMGIRIGICHNLYNRMTGRNQGYLDGSDPEHIVLMGH